MSRRGSGLWLVAGACEDPASVPERARVAMEAAERVYVAAGAAPALALWARPECVRRVGTGASAARDAADASAPAATTVWIAPQRPPTATAAELRARHAEFAVVPCAAAAPLDRSLEGATVVLTRPWQDIQMTASAYAVRRARVLPWPLSTIVPPPDPAALAAAARRAAGGGYGAVGVTSARAAAAWCEAVRAAAAADAASGARSPHRPFLVAVGEATAAALLTGGLAPDLVTEGGGEAMGAALGERAADGAVLIVGTANGRREAEDTARAAGAQVDVVAAYGMADPPWREAFDPWVREALAGDSPQSVYFTWFSPRAVERGLRALGREIERGAWVCVGETTATAARHLGTPEGGLEVADSASAVAVRDAVVRLHRSRHRRG